MMHKMNRRQILKTLTMLVLLLFAGIQMKAQNEHPWSGARVAIFGDSISDSNANNGNEKYYWYMSRDIGIIPYSYAETGVNGTGFLFRRAVWKRSMVRISTRFSS